MAGTRLRTRVLVAASWLACHLPEGPLVSLARTGGDLWYRLTPKRAAQARRNLRRVVEDLAATGRGPAYARAAADDERALERLVRHAYQHAALYYLETMRTPALRPADVERRVTIETPDVVDEAFAREGGVIFIGLHFGALELPALYLASRVGGAVAPMETIDDPELQDWFIRTRGAVGIRIVGLREARRALTAALRDGSSVGLVGDRDITGGGTRTTLFGAPASLPLGPAMLAVETGAPTYVSAVRRLGTRRYAARVAPVEIPTEGSRRDRVTAGMSNIAAAFEDAIAVAPEQWWAAFFPIWPDLEGDPAAVTPGAAADGATS